MESEVRGKKSRSFVTAIAICLAVMVLAPPIVQAAAQKVNITKSITLPVKGSVSVKNNGATAAPQDWGALPGESAPKRQMVDMIAGGDGFWGVGYCGHPTAANRKVIVPAAEEGDPDNVVAGILIAGDGGATVTVKAPELPTGTTPVATFNTTATNPVQSIALPSGLRVSPSDLEFECTAGDLPTDTFIVIGH